MMKDKKHIDRLFQEKFKDFEAVPNDDVWENIKPRLQKNKKVIPVWWRYASIAALLLLLFTVGDSFLENVKNTPNNRVVDTERTTPSNLKVTSNQEDNLSSNKTETTISSNTSIVNSEKEQTLNTNTSNPNLVVNIETPDNINTTNSNSNTSNLDNLSSNKKKKLVSPKTSIANSEKDTTLKTNISNPNIVEEFKSSDDILLPKDKSIANNLQKTDGQPSKVISSELDNKNSHSIINDDDTQINSITGNETVISEPEVENQKESNLIDINEELANAEDLKEVVEDEDTKNKWGVYASIAPVYYSSFGKGSTIHSQFNENTKTGETNTSYGINVTYALNKKLTLRSGVNSLNLSYDTDNVILFENQSPSFTARSSVLKNIDLTKYGKEISVLSANNLGVQQISNVIGDLFDAAISQRISYLEVPLELQYTLADKKFGISVIGGFSAFFLNENKVYSEFQGRNNLIGEANNINDVSYSANFGVGVNYNFSKKFKFNLEPTFKYQINAYNNTSGDFKPYIIGVYTGFSFKF